MQLTILGLFEQNSSLILELVKCLISKLAACGNGALLRLGHDGLAVREQPLLLVGLLHVVFQLGRQRGELGRPAARWIGRLRGLSSHGLVVWELRLVRRW